MSNNIKNCIDKLKFIASIKNPILRKRILYLVADDCLYKALNEIAINTIKGNVQLNLNQKKKLNKYKKHIKKLSTKVNNKSKRIKLVKQSGGFLPILIPAVASILGSILAK